MMHRVRSAGGTAQRKPSLLYHDPERFFPSPGCSVCVDRLTCGSVSFETGLFDCSIHCCGRPESCQWVCRRNPQFRSQLQEIGGFGFDNVVVPDAPPVGPLPDYVPQIFHGSLRVEPLGVQTVAVKLSEVFSRQTGQPRFKTRQQLARHFEIDDSAQVIVTGVDQDAPIERWWEIGLDARQQVLSSLAEMQIAAVTTPNYSLSLDWPRPGDLAAMKRILISGAEMMTAGLPTAFHVNGRTSQDFEQWNELLRRADSINCLAYEFTTGAALDSRREQHVSWLCELAAGQSRPLDIIVFGDSRVVQPLKRAFANVTWIDTTSFMKTVHRQKAVRVGNGKLSWRTMPTPAGASLHGLLAHNIEECRAHFVMRTAT